MNKYLRIAVLALCVTGKSFSQSPITANVTSNYYPWSKNSNANFSIAIPTDFSMSFSARFSANPAHDFHIGLYSPNFVASYALGPYNPDAVVELHIGGWDAGANSTQQSAVYFGIYTETGYYRKKILFTDPKTPRQEYIIPGSRGSYIEYIYTLVASATECTITLEYLDPTTASNKTLINITQRDFAPDILATIQSPSFPGFTKLGFHTYDTAYSVQNASISVPQRLIDAITKRIATAQTLITVSMQQNAQNIYTQASATIANAKNLPDTATVKATLLSTATGIQRQSVANLAFIQNAIMTLQQPPPRFTTPASVLAAHRAIDNLITQLTDIDRSYTINAATLTDINTQINAILDVSINASIRAASEEARASIAKALSSLSKAQLLLQPTDNLAQVTVASASALPSTADNRQKLIEAAEKIRTDPTSGTIYYLNYLATALNKINNAPTTYKSIADARTMKLDADALAAAAEAIVEQNVSLVSSINSLQALINSAQEAADLIAQMNAIAAANSSAQRSIQAAVLSIKTAQSLIQETNNQAMLAITAAQNLPSIPAIDTSSLIATAESLHNDSTTGTITILTTLANLLQTLENYPANFTNIPDAEEAQQIADAASNSAQTITMQNPALLVAVNNVKSMISDVEKIIAATLLNDATLLANAHIITAVAAVENAQLLTQTSDQQINATIADIDALPDSILIKEDLLKQAIALLTNSETTASLSSTLAILKAFSGSYESVLAAQTAKKIADDASSAALSVSQQNQTIITTLQELQNIVKNTQIDVTNNINALASATAKTNTHVAAAITSVQNAQLITENANIEAQQVIAAAQALPDVVDNKKDLLAMATELLPLPATLSYLSSSLDILQQAPTIFTSVSDALATQSTADSIKSQSDDIIKQNTNTLTALTNAQQAITQAHIDATVAALAVANAIAVAHTERTIQTLQEALSLAEKVRMQSETVRASAQALSDSVSVKQNFLILVNNLVVDPVTVDYLNATVTRLKDSKVTFTTLNDAQNAQLNADGINAAAQAITTNLNNSLNSLLTLQNSINTAALAAATTNTTNHIMLAMTALENAKALMRTADELAQDAVSSAQALINNQALLTQAYQLRTHATTGTQTLLALIQNAMNTLQAFPITFATLIDASNTQNKADAFCATAQQIIAGAPSILNTIAGVQDLILAAQKPTTSTPDPSPSPTLPPSDLTPLERLNITIALELTAAQRALIEAQNSAAQAYALITQIITDIATAPTNTVNANLLPAATSLKSTITTILNKITATQTSLAKQSPPFANQALALKARAIVESSANYAKTALNMIDARMQSINSLQSKIVHITTNT